MARAQGGMKSKRSKTIVAAALTIVLVAIVWSHFVHGRPNHQAKRLPDGALLVLNHISSGDTNEFTHGKLVEKFLRNVIPATGVKVFSLQLARPTRENFYCPPGKTELVAEFKLIGTNAGNHPLVSPAFYREFRCVIRGEKGIAFVYEFWPGQFRTYLDGYFGYVIAERYPRDSRKLWLSIERREKRDEGGPWHQVAEFEIKNPAPPVIQLWKAEAADTAKKFGDLEICLGQITVATQSFSARDIWNHRVTMPFQVRSAGLLLTNWSPMYIQAEDASGNWDYFASHRSLDPRFVWKLDADFEPESDFPPETVLTVPLPKPSSQMTTNLMNLPVTIRWDGQWLDVNMPTAARALALRYVCLADEQGRKAFMASGSWNQHFFRKGDFMVQTEHGVTTSQHWSTLTFAIVTNVHATFYAQPSLITGTNPVPGF